MVWVWDVCHEKIENSVGQTSTKQVTGCHRHCELQQVEPPDPEFFIAIGVRQCEDVEHIGPTQKEHKLKWWPL